jgi:hypothetical protein
VRSPVAEHIRKRAAEVVSLAHELRDVLTNIEHRLIERQTEIDYLQRQVAFVVKRDSRHLTTEARMQLVKVGDDDN